MNDNAYDISYLEAELIDAGMAPARVERAPSIVQAPRVDPLVAAQEAMARELLAAAEVHEAMIQQYLRISDAVSSNGLMH